MPETTGQPAGISWRRIVAEGVAIVVSIGGAQPVDNAPLSHEDAPAYPGIPNKHRRRLDGHSGRLMGFCLRLVAHSRMLTFV